MAFLQTEGYYYYIYIYIYIYVVLRVTNHHICRHGSPTELWA